MAGRLSERAKMAHASDLVARTLADNFQLVAEHTISLRQGTFVETIDAVGGLDITLPEDVDGTGGGFGHYYAGRQVLDGEAVLDYMSIYAADGDTGPAEWGRLARQNQVLGAFLVQLTHPQTLLKVPALLRRFHQDVVTDLKLNDFLDLACMLDAADVAVEHVELDESLLTEIQNQMLVPDVAGITALLEEEFGQ